MPQRTYTVIPVPGLRRSNIRAIAFLECSEDEGLDARRKFEKLREKTHRKVMARFDYWIDCNSYNKYFHGWDRLGYRNCFVFKWNDRERMNRLYGFLYHPFPAIRPRFEVCVLAFHRIKPGAEADENALNQVVALSQENAVKDTVRKTFKDWEVKK